MTTLVHDEEPDTGREVARALLDGQFPAVAEAPLVALSNTGSDNALFRLGTDLVMRLPRSPGRLEVYASSSAAFRILVTFRSESPRV